MLDQLWIDGAGCRLSLGLGVLGGEATVTCEQ